MLKVRHRLRVYIYIYILDWTNGWPKRHRFPNIVDENETYVNVFPLWGGGQGPAESAAVRLIHSAITIILAWFRIVPAIRENVRQLSLQVRPVRIPNETVYGHVGVLVGVQRGQRYRGRGIYVIFVRSFVADR